MGDHHEHDRRTVLSVGSGRSLTHQDPQAILCVHYVAEDVAMNRNEEFSTQGRDGD